MLSDLLSTRAKPLRHNRLTNSLATGYAYFVAVPLQIAQLGPGPRLFGGGFHPPYRASALPTSGGIQLIQGWAQRDVISEANTGCG